MGSPSRPAVRSQPERSIGLDFETAASPRIDHIGIAVESIEQALDLYRYLGCAVGQAVEVPQEKVRAIMIRTGEGRIELLEATSPDSPIAKFIASRGPGVHHLALKVRDLDRTVERLRASGRRLVSDSIQTGGAGGYRYIFVHPKSGGGVLIELIEEP